MISEKKLIALDLDGTTLESSGILSGKVKQALRRARASGHIVAFATGRADTDMTPLEPDFGEVDYLILNNGAKLVRASDREVLFNEVLDQTAAARLIEACLSEGVQLYLINGKDWYVCQDNDRVREYSTVAGTPPKYYASLAEVPVDHIEGMTIIGDPSRIHQLVKDCGSSLWGVESEPGYIDILNPDMNKWTGIQRLLKLLDMDCSQVIAVGDYDNDLEMIRNAGIGIAVANAREVVKQAADYVALHNNDQDVCADVIEELILHEKAGCLLKNHG